MYNSTDRASFENIKNYWLGEVHRYIVHDVSMVLMGHYYPEIADQEKIVSTIEGKVEIVV